MQKLDLLNETSGNREEADAFITKQTGMSGLSRRQFMQLIAACAGQTPIPIEKAMADDTLWVYAMNGQSYSLITAFPCAC